MLRLIFLRHGEAESNSDHGDKGRHLTVYGKKKIEEQAKRIESKGISPNLILSSDATRTRETTSILKETFPEVPTEYSQGLYLAGFDEFLAEISEFDDTEGTLILVGHNPGWSDIAGQLVRSPIGLSPGDFCSCTYNGSSSELHLAATDFGKWEKEQF